MSASSPDPVDTTVPNLARVYDYLLGGKNHFAADRRHGDAIVAASPGARTAARENRRFIERAVRRMAAAGITQYIDVGSGYPTTPGVHSIAQKTAPHARVVYIDNDPLVMLHNQALTSGTRDGVLAYLDADLRQPDSILHDPVLHKVIDFSAPVGVLLCAVLDHLDDTDDPHAAVARLRAVMAPGSYLAISHATLDPPVPAHIAEAVTDLHRAGDGNGTFRPRTRAEVTRFAVGLDLLRPGVTSIVDWRPDDEPTPLASAADVGMYGLVARRPTHQPRPTTPAATTTATSPFYGSGATQVTAATTRTSLPRGRLPPDGAERDPAMENATP